jgi:hypothetical protein
VKGSEQVCVYKTEVGRNSYHIPSLVYRNWSEGGDQLGQVAGEPFTDDYGRDRGTSTYIYSVMVTTTRLYPLYSRHSSHHPTNMPVRAQTPTVASSSATAVKLEPGSVFIKQEPSDDDSQPQGRYACSALSIPQVICNLSAMYNQEPRVRQVIERDKYSSCCDQPLMLGEPVLTTYKRGEQEYANFQGCPTAFASNLDENGEEITLKKREARFFHTQNPDCRRIAIEEEEDDMWLVRRDQPNDDNVPSGRLPCNSCGDNTTVAGRRETMQVKFGTEEPTFVFCDENCLRAHYDQVASSMIDTKGGIGEGKTDSRTVDALVYFRMINQTSLNQVCEFTGQEREESLQSLENTDNHGAPCNQGAPFL